MPQRDHQGAPAPVKWDSLVAEAHALGYTVELVEYCECADSPGIIGSRAGVCIPRVRRILIREVLEEADRLTVLQHELEHARGAGHEIDVVSKPILDYERERDPALAQKENE